MKKNKNKKIIERKISGINDKKIIDNIYDILENNYKEDKEDRIKFIKKSFIDNKEYKQYEIVFGSYEDYICRCLTKFLEDKSCQVELLRNKPDWDYDTLVIRIK